MPARDAPKTRTNLSRRIEGAERDRDAEAATARDDKLAPIGAGPARRRLGLAKGKFVVPDDIDQDNELIARMFYGTDE
jgi:hypothetical protein